MLRIGASVNFPPENNSSYLAKDLYQKAMEQYFLMNIFGGDIIQALDMRSLKQKMAFQDAVSHIVFSVLKGKLLAAYKALGKSVRQAWFD